MSIGLLQMVWTYEMSLGIFSRVAAPLVNSDSLKFILVNLRLFLSIFVYSCQSSFILVNLRLFFSIFVYSSQSSFILLNLPLFMQIVLELMLPLMLLMLILIPNNCSSWTFCFNYYSRRITLILLSSPSPYVTTVSGTPSFDTSNVTTDPPIFVDCTHGTVENPCNSC